MTTGVAASGYEYGHAPESQEEDDLVEELEQALSERGFHDIVGTRKAKTQRRIVLIVPVFVALSMSLGLVVANSLDRFSVLVFIAVFGVLYLAAVAIGQTFGEGASLAVVTAMAIAWVVTGIWALVDSGWESPVRTHVVPVAVVAAVKVVPRLLGAIQNVPLLFAVVLVALFIPLFTQELWEMIGRLSPGQAVALAAWAVLPVFLAVRRQVVDSVGDAFTASARRLEDQAGRARATKTLSGVLRRPRYAPDVPLALVRADERLHLAGGLLDHSSGAESGPGRKLAEAFEPPIPTVYAPIIAERLEATLRRRVNWLLPFFVLAMTGAIAVYIYVLAALAIGSEAVSGWTDRTVEHHRLSDISLEGVASLGDLTIPGLVSLDDAAIPGGTFFSLSLFLGAIATAIFLALVLTEERYSTELANAVIHGPIERSLQLGIPYYHLRAPHNDLFERAQKLYGTAGQAPGTNVHATREHGEPRHAPGASGKTVWYRWQAPSSGPVTIDTDGSTFATLLAVYVGASIERLTIVAVDYDAGRTHWSSVGSDATRLSFEASAGTVYWIAIDGYGDVLGSEPDGEIVLNYSSEPPPNDSFGAAMELPGANGRVVGANLNARKEEGEPPHAGTTGGRSVWYRWEAPAGGTTTIDVAGSDFDVRVAVYTGDALSVLDTVGATDEFTTAVTFEADAGTVYSIAVDGFAPVPGAAAAGTFVLEYWSGVPANDAFATPERLLGSIGTVSGSNRHATKEPGEPNHADDEGGRSVWYQWTALSDGPVAFDTAGSTFDTLLAVYEGEAFDKLPCVASNDDVDPWRTTSAVEFEARAGTAYRIAVDGARGSAEAADSGTITLSWVAPPENDGLSSADDLTGPRGRVMGSNIRATKEADEPDHAGNPGGASVWYRWVAPDTGIVTMRTEGSGFDTLLAVYTGDALERLTEIAANDDTETSITSLLEFSATAETTYFVAVDGYRYGDTASQGPITLSWEVRPADG